MEEEFSDPVHIAIDGTIDLHHFSPKDLKHLIPDYLRECIDRNIYEVKIIHGKGKGVLRKSVHAILTKCSEVQSFHLAPAQHGSWGATIVMLHDKGRKKG